MSLKTRLHKLESQHPKEPAHIELWLYSLEDDTVSGPDGKVYMAEEAERLQQETSGIVINLRRTP